MSKFPYKPRAPQSLKAAVSAAVADLGGLDAVAALPGVGRSRTTLFKYGDDGDENLSHNMPMDVAAVLTREAARRGLAPTLAWWLSDQAGLPPADSGTALSLPQLGARLGQETAETFAALSAALADNALSPAERRELIAALEDVVRVARLGIAALSCGAGTAPCLGAGSAP
ncbi:MAG: hypothetical protein SFV21_12570 [Rhodospirillaceae bacterium]|nr:hypothetical protein [Rhodospirillaceae bacterium]